MSRIDYSKWDHIEDSDEEEDKDQQQGPRVTKLEQPSRITTQSDGSILVQPSTTMENEKSSIKKTGLPQLASESSVTAKEETASIPTEWTEKGDYVLLEHDSKELWWSQDRYSVTFRIALPPHEKIRTVQVKPILPYSERNRATGSQKPRLLVHDDDSSTSVWFQCELPHPVHLAEEEEKDIDWTIMTGPPNHTRYLTIVLYKATPMPGMFLWWKQPFTNGPERNLEHEDEVSSSSRAFQQAWSDAQKQFAEKSKTRPQFTV